MGKQIILTLTILGVAGAALLAAVGAAPAAQMHRIVFQVTAEGDEQWDALLNNVENVRKAFGPENTEIAVVTHGKGLGLVMAGNEAREQRMKKLSDGGVGFVACENTMTRKNVTKDQLVPFSLTVDSGVAEVVRKQEQGWSYIKSGL